MSTGSTEAPAPDEEPAASREQDDVKAQFRDALARKQRRHHAHAKGAEDGAKIHESNSVASTRRMFRRKSG